MEWLTQNIEEAVVSCDKCGNPQMKIQKDFSGLYSYCRKCDDLRSYIRPNEMNPELCTPVWPREWELRKYLLENKWETTETIGFCVRFLREDKSIIAIQEWHPHYLGGRQIWVMKNDLVLSLGDNYGK